MYKIKNRGIIKGALVALISGIISVITGGLLLSLRRVFSSTNFDCVPLSVTMIGLGIVCMAVGFVTYLVHRMEE